jgi:drug/metabolite transporter (DMT)-like permease
MSATVKKFVILRIRKRPWWYWLGAVVWLALVLFFLNTGLGSSAEMEPRAALISYVTTAILLVIGAVIYIVERRKAG